MFSRLIGAIPSLADQLSISGMFCQVHTTTTSTSTIEKELPILSYKPTNQHSKPRRWVETTELKLDPGAREQRGTGNQLLMWIVLISTRRFCMVCASSPGTFVDAGN